MDGSPLDNVSRVVVMGPESLPLPVFITLPHLFLGESRETNPNHLPSRTVSKDCGSRRGVTNEVRVLTGLSCGSGGRGPVVNKVSD